MIKNGNINIGLSYKNVTLYKYLNFFFLKDKNVYEK